MNPDVEKLDRLSRIPLTPTSRATFDQADQVARVRSRSDPAFPKTAWVGLFEEYRAAMDPCTEAPDEYHWAVFFLTIGLFLGRRLYIENPVRLYPNAYVLLIGPAGRNKKSTCLRFGQQLSESISAKYETIYHPSSLEGIYKALAEKEGTRALIFQDEFKGLLAASHRAATGNLLSGLNTLYACPTEDRLTRKEPITVTKPFVSLITGAPQKWIEETFEAGDFAGGFMSRMMILGGKRKEPHPRPPAPDQTRLSAIAREMQVLAQRLPEDGLQMKFSEKAGNLYDDWYRSYNARLDRSSEQEAVLGVRTHEFVLKVATVYSFLEGARELTESAVGIAIDVGEYLHENAISRFAGLAFTRRGRLEERILTMLKDGPVTRRQIQRQLGSHYDTEEMVRALTGLRQLERITETEILSESSRKLQAFQLSDWEGE